MNQALRRNQTKVDILMAALLIVPLSISLAKLTPIPGSTLVAHFISLSGLPHHFRTVADSLLFVPLGALVVVIFRLTLGLRVLGLFRPILLALAFDVIGIAMSVAFLLVVLVVIVLLRPLLTGRHSYARIAVLLSLVAALLLVPLMLGIWWDIAWLRDLAYFPVIALCLTCESFAKVLDTAGPAEAAWRTANTILAAIVITMAAGVFGALGLLYRFPELLFAQAGCVLLISRHLNLRLFEGVNPLALQFCRSTSAAAEGAKPRLHRSATKPRPYPVVARSIKAD